jgi:lysyl-tRNA synthetase class 2
MKRLLAAGSGPIYQIARVFRAGERGPRHNPEFTLVEWYRPGDDYEAGMNLLDELCQSLLELGPAERLSYQQAFERYAGLDPHTAATGELDRAVAAAGGASLNFAADDRDGRLDYLLVTRCEPHLGAERPTILFDYPASQAALAQVRSGPPPVAERFELYVRGIELANGYHELLDAEVLLERNRINNARRLADGKPPLPEESRLVSAMRSGLPDSVGVALGFDRVVMLAAGAQTIDDALAFPIDRA